MLDRVSDAPYSPEKREENRAWWDIFRFPLGPVVGGEGSGECTLTQCNSKINQPEEDEQIAQLQEEDVAVIHALPAVECKETLSSWTLLSDVGPVKSLPIYKIDENRCHWITYIDSLIWQVLLYVCSLTFYKKRLTSGLQVRLACLHSGCADMTLYMASPDDARKLDLIKVQIDWRKVVKSCHLPSWLAHPR